MATKLEGLHIKKVDFVDQGANQMANIKIKKSKDGEEISNPEVGLFKRFVNWITGELSKSDSEITKSATTFNEQINAVSMDAIRDEILVYLLCTAEFTELYSVRCRNGQFCEAGRNGNKHRTVCRSYERIYPELGFWHSDEYQKESGYTR